jgi:hypothetical protein
MFSLYRYKKKGLPYGLIKLHEFLLEDIISYFERGKFIRKKVKEARKLVKQALRFAKRKKIYPSKKTNQALECIEELLEEIRYTRQVLKKSAIEMERVLDEINGEKFINISALIMTAMDYFKEKKLERGMELLKETQNKLEEKYLSKTREKILTDFDSEIKKLKYEIEQKNNKALNS